MVDPDRLHYRLDLLGGYLTELRRLRDLDRSAYLREAYAGRYLVQVAAQTCIDLGAHLIASEGWRAPRDFADTFTVLMENGILPEVLAGRLRALAGLRNRLVHVYDVVDDARVHELLAAGLTDVEAFAQALARLAVQQTRPPTPQSP